TFNSGFTYTSPTGTRYISFILPKVAFTWYVFIGSIVTFAVGSIASLIFRDKSRAKTVVTSLILLLATIQFTTPATAKAESKHPSQTEAQAAQTASDFAAISTLINQAIAAKKLPGVVVVIGHNKKVVFQQAYGNRALEPTIEPMTKDTIFDMASLTKCLVTATAIMQLYEAGKLQFDDPVAKYLPAFAANGKENVTIRELLTHYSGLPADVDLKDPWGLSAPNKAEGIRRAMESPLANPPGTKFVYSDINFITLGALVEKLSGQALDVYALEHIFKPLGMMDTHYHDIGKACGQRHISGAATELVISNLPTVCSVGSGTWLVRDIQNTAPTAHDDESKDNPSSNPNFDHLLRGTVHDPTTRRMGGVAGHAGVFSTAADISLFAQALLDKLLQNTGPFPLKQSTLRLMTTPQQPATAQSGATVFTPDGKTTTGIATRGFGWDINTAFSRPRGEIFPIGSFGHTGFTGTSLWMDPASNTYVILLANAVYPRVNPPISALRGQVATAAARALGLYPGVSVLPPSPPADSATTLTGIEVLQSTHFDILLAAAHRHNEHLRLGLLTNQTGLDSAGHRTIDILFHSIPQVELKTLFSPEHGILGAKDTAHIANDTDPTTHLPVISLYGPKDSDRRPILEALKDLDAVVIDLQDAGVRFYTYESVVGYFLEAAAKEKAAGHTLEIILLDRPNPINGVSVQGPVSDAGRESYINYMP
ncbi:MAG TPA: serine hydrolase, partial [Edaphobacter sp.]|nr:serine hydrolase [Edaphobacter sp.]